MAKLLTVLLLVTISVVFTTAEDETFSETCLNAARGQTKSDGSNVHRRMMAGGWKEADKDEMDDTTTQILAAVTGLAMNMENTMSNDRNKYGVSQQVEDMEIYVQVVNGLNYCIRFEAESDDSNAPVKECVTQVYVPFSALRGGVPDQSQLKNVKCAVM